MDTRIMQVHPDAGVVWQPDSKRVLQRPVVMELLSDPAVKAGLALLILIIMSAAAFFLVSRLRDYTNRDWDSAPDGLLNLEEMRLKGDISEEEFRTIQAASRATDDGEAPTTQSESPANDFPADDSPTDKSAPAPNRDA